MGFYKYIAFDNKKKIKSILHAESILEAKEYLFSKNYILIKISEIKKSIKPLSEKETLEFFIDLKNLLKSTIPLYDSLVIIANKTESKKIKYLTLDISSKVRSGEDFSSCLKDHKKSFNIIMVAMIENSLKTGNLEKAIEEIIIILKKSMKLKKMLVSSITYPLILLTFCVLVLSALFFYIIPSLFELFENREVNLFTQFVINTSKFLKANLFLLIIFLNIILAIIFVAYFNINFKKTILKYLLKLPLIKNFMIKVSIVRFFRSFANLLLNGESYFNSLKLSKNMINYPPLEIEISNMEEEILKGESLSKLMKKSKLMPSMCHEMIYIAEKSSNLENIFFNIASIYEEEIERKLKKLTTYFQPIILIILGVIIGFVVLSVLLPLTDVSSFVGE